MFFNSRGVTNCAMYIKDDKLYQTGMEGKISCDNLQEAAEDVLDSQCSMYLGTDSSGVESNVELNNKLANHVYDNTSRTEDGRLIMPLMWNSSVQHLLGNNENLSKQILKSNYKKLSKDNEKLLLTDKVFKEQEELGIIERIDNFEQYKTETLSTPFYLI